MGGLLITSRHDKSYFYRCLFLDLDTEKAIVYKVYVNVK